MVVKLKHVKRSNFSVYFNVNFNVLLKKYILHPLVVAGTCEYSEEPSGSKNAGNFLTSCRSS